MVKPNFPKSRVIYESGHPLDNREIGQTKKHSLYESILNIFVGFIVAMVAQIIIFPLYDIHIPFNYNLQIGGWMTLVSLIRNYYLRRWFNKLTTQKKRRYE